MMHPDQWASELLKAEAECLNDWDLFGAELRRMYGDQNRQMNSATKAYSEYLQGAVDSNETVKVYENRMRSNWREAGWKTDQDGVQHMLYDMVWAGLRPGMKARIKPCAGETGRFSSIDELFKKAEDVEIKSNPNRDRRAQPAPTAEKTQKSSGKDKKRPHPSESENRDPVSTTQSTGGSSSRDTKATRSYPQHMGRIQDGRKERGQCTRCGESRHKTLACPKYSRPDRRPNPNHDRDHDRDDRQDREKRPKATDITYNYNFVPQLNTLSGSRSGYVRTGLCG